MRSFVVVGLLAIVVGMTLAASSMTAEPAGKKNPHVGKLRHVVRFKFKEDTTPEQVEAIEDAFGQLPSKVSEIVDYEWGTNNSPEGLTKGFTHCFLVTFNDQKGRDVYLPHAAHKEFVKLAGPHFADVLVVDYVAKD